MSKTNLNHNQNFESIFRVRMILNCNMDVDHNLVPELYIQSQLSLSLDLEYGS